jgi:5-methylcytosine-specific restriction endonuclease McrA
MFQVGQAAAASNGGDGVIANLAINPQAIDRELRRIARNEARLLHEKTHLLVHAVRLRVWAVFGRRSLLEYLEEIFGYTPKVARDHVRVAFAIEEMPVLGEMLESGEQSYTALRELARVATAETVDEWREAARGMNVRQVEQLVSARAKGDRPGDDRDPELAVKRVTFEVRAGTDAKLRQARQVLAAEHDGFLDDDAFLEALCTAVLDGGAPDQGRARHQIMTTICEECGKGWQDAAGRVIAIEPVDVQRAECDAQRVGSTRKPERATQDVAPMVRRYVWRRDHGRCCVPGCRASRNIDVHHLVHRADGGGHEAENLLLLCGGHHRALHEGKLEIHGTAPRLTFAYVNSPTLVGSPTPPVGRPESALREARIQPQVPIPTPHVGPHARRHVGRSSFATVALTTQAKQALAQLGFKKPDAARYVDEAFAMATGVPTLEDLIRAALQRSRRTNA